jgi:hypothetical protein
VNLDLHFEMQLFELQPRFWFNPNIQRNYEKKRWLRRFSLDDVQKLCVFLTPQQSVFEPSDSTSSD